MTDDVRADARRLLQGITSGDWTVEDDGYDQAVYAEDGMPGTAYVSERCPQGRADAEFIAASPTLVQGLLDAVDQERDRALRLAIRAAGCEKAETERDAALVTLARIQAVAADVDQDGGHSGLARHILNIIGGEA
ncbi:hypothetical protein BH769_gp74 [Gordonia phage BritBrat]|uniref:Uncharacterized protein n=1 Tax=Gordonia phage BritBrat TaxID=1838064 RepID=A0A166Y0H5_9CAUD|nr:hypothetical protein BH769_gp74 [Gordonia phage BritBrat]ANA85277.1 hypothetical protein PBI_BRITBRAT_74 [Gordonia phage BritBrat]